MTAITACRARVSVAVPLALVAAALGCTATTAVDRSSMPQALDRLARDGDFSGAVVIRGSDGVRFAAGYGSADPFTGRPFTAETPVDSGSLAKPVTAAAVLMLARDGKVDLDAPVRRFIPSYPHEQATVRQLLSHSAGLPVEQMLEPLAGKTNEMFLAEMSERQMATLFPPGSGFVYCNLCYTTLALLIERVSDKPYLELVREMVALPAAVTIRPPRLDDWKGRGIGYRRADDGTLARADSYEDELFYGTANFSVSAEQLARWGSEWWQPTLRPILDLATKPATIDGKSSGLTLGSWYCAPEGRRCHYLGHHEGFHHMLYWDLDREVAVAMVSNNTLSPALQQRLQRALVLWSEGRGSDAERELTMLLPDEPGAPGRYTLPTGEEVAVITKGERVAVTRGGINYLAFKVGAGIRYVPGLDLYVAGDERGGLRWLSLYEDMVAAPDAAGG